MSTLSADVEELIRREMARGGYTDENELLRLALSAWVDNREMIAAVREGLADAEAGRARPWREVLDEVRQRNDLSSGS